MLTHFDDYPIHQTPEPIAHTASSDRCTYDRFWYNGHARDGSFYFGVALCRYPNLGIMDCSLSVALGDRQCAFHASRRAPTEPTELTVGPFRIEILEPMGRHRVYIEPNDTGIECDLVFTPHTGAVEEGRQTRRNERFVAMDVTRLDQFGSWEGSIRCENESIDVPAVDTLGIKDRSWGIRPVGERYPGGAPLEGHNGTHFVWLPLQWEDRCTIAGSFENHLGKQWHNDQVILPRTPQWNAATGAAHPGTVTWQGKVQHNFDFQPGTRRARAATITMNDQSGEQLEIILEPLLLHRMKGLGYLHPTWGHGMWQGELAVASESWDNNEVDPLAMENLHIQQVVKARCGDNTGYGVLEQLHIGPHPGLGFSQWFDGAP